MKINIGLSILLNYFPSLVRIQYLPYYEFHFANMKKAGFIITFMLLSRVIFCQVLEPEKVKQDFMVFKAALSEAHPGIYRFQPKATIDSLFLETEKMTGKPASPQDLFKLLSPLVASVHCGHTKFYPEGKYDEEHLYHYFYSTERLFPLKLWFSNGKAYIQDNYDSQNYSDKGAELLSINGRSMPDLIYFMLKNIASDGHVRSSGFLELSSFFPAYYANLIGNPDEFQIEVKDDMGKCSTMRLRSISIDRIREYEKNHTSEHEDNFTISYPKEGIALIKIKAFYPLSKDDDFKKFLKDAFAEIQAKNTTKLIIDLRNNEGGNDRWGAMLFSYLTDIPFRYYETLRIRPVKYSFREYASFPKFFGLMKLFLKKEKDGSYLWTKHKNLRVQEPAKNPFTGETFVLVNGFSFSVTAEFAAVAKASGRIHLLGEETGGAYSGNNSGVFVIVTLPNSRLVLGIPLAGYYMAVPDIQPFDRGVLPDINISPDIRQVTEGRDPVLELALKLSP